MSKPSTIGKAREEVSVHHGLLFGYIAQVYSHSDEIGGSAETLAIGGDSAGGNLAAAVSLMARDRALQGKDAPQIRFQALISPVSTPRF